MLDNRQVKYAASRVWKTMRLTEAKRSTIRKPCVWLDKHTGPAMRGRVGGEGAEEFSLPVSVPVRQQDEDQSQDVACLSHSQPGSGRCPPSPPSRARSRLRASLRCGYGVAHEEAPTMLLRSLHSIGELWVFWIECDGRRTGGRNDVVSLVD